MLFMLKTNWLVSFFYNGSQVIMHRMAVTMKIVSSLSVTLSMQDRIKIQCAINTQNIHTVSVIVLRFKKGVGDCVFFTFKTAPGFKYIDLLKKIRSLSVQHCVDSKNYKLLQFMALVNTSYWYQNMEHDTLVVLCCVHLLTCCLPLVVWQLKYIDIRYKRTQGGRQHMNC